MRIKYLIFVYFLAGSLFFQPGKVKAILIADDYRIGTPRYYTRPKTTYNPPTVKDEWGRPDKKVDRDEEGNPITVTNSESRSKWYDQVGANVWVPNDALKEYCKTHGGCELDTILAKAQNPATGRWGLVVVSEDYKYAGLSGTQGNEYEHGPVLEGGGGSQEGIAGFYLAPNGGWYPIGVPPPPTEPGRDFILSGVFHHAEFFLVARVLLRAVFGAA